MGLAYGSAMAATRGTAALDAAGIAYEVHVYRHQAKGALAASAALGIAAERLAKSLVVVVDDEPVFALVAGASELSPKKLARLAGAKAARLAEKADAERWTGYQRGGISPFGSRRALPVFADAAWLAHDRVCLNGGRRGLIVELASAALMRLLNATVADLAA